MSRPTKIKDDKHRQAWKSHNPAVLDKLMKAGQSDKRKPFIFQVPSGSLVEFRQLLKSKKYLWFCLGINQDSSILGESYFEPYLMFSDEAKEPVPTNSNEGIVIESTTGVSTFRFLEIKATTEMFLPKKIDSDSILMKEAGELSDKWANITTIQSNLFATKENGVIAAVRCYGYDTIENFKAEFPNRYNQIIDSIRSFSFVCGVNPSPPKKDWPLFTVYLMMEANLSGMPIDVYNSRRIPLFYYEDIATPCPPTCNDEL